MRTRWASYASRGLYTVSWSLWLLVSILTGAIVAKVMMIGVHYMGLPYGQSTTELLFQGILGYAVSLFIFWGGPVASRRWTLTRYEIGVGRLVSWSDIGLALAGGILYLMVSIVLLWLANAVIPGFNVNQQQDLGFTSVFGFERVLAFVVLVVVAPIVEEMIFRGVFYGALRKAHVPAWVSAVVVSVLFGLVHGQLNVGIDVFALSLVLCVLREVTGNVWAGILVHMLKNVVAFYLLFVLTGF